jgi:Ricin-type beta-trefoil lectin domain
MPMLKRAAALTVTAGLLAFGGLSTATAARASTGVANCSTDDQELAAGFIPNCTSSGTVRYPTSLTLTVASPQLAALLGATGQGIADQWAVNCDEGGGVTYTNSGTFVVNAGATGATYSLPTGGAVPNSCTVTAEVQTIAGLSAGLLSLDSLEVEQTVTTTAAVPGVIRTGNSTTAATCADDTGNRNVNNNPVQVYTCLGDLADFWVQDRFGEFVHDGLCMTENLSGAVVLGQCAQGHEQEWAQAKSGGEVSLAATPGLCLTATSTVNGTPLRVRDCTGAAGQRWTIPGPSS